MVNLHGRCFLTLKDFTPEEIGYLLDLAADLKAKKKKGIYGHSLENKNIALIFEKPSTRTRCAFTVGAQDEGGRAEYLGVEDIQLGKKESVEDTARVLGRMFDGIEFRGFLHENVEKLAKYSGVPVWNGLTDDFHPTQILADFLTMREKFGTIAGKNFVFLGDGRNNMANSFLVGCGKMGVNLTIIAPKELWPEESLVELARGYAKEAGSTITITEDVDAVQGRCRAQTSFTRMSGHPWARKPRQLSGSNCSPRIRSTQPLWRRRARRARSSCTACLRSREMK